MPHSSINAGTQSSRDPSSWSEKSRSRPRADHAARASSRSIPLPPHKPIVPDHIRQACELFLEDWTCDAEPEIREFLTWVPPEEQRTLFTKLLEIELDVLQRRQALPIMSRYLRRYPQYVTEVLQAYEKLKARSAPAASRRATKTPDRVKLVTLSILGGPHRGPTFSFTPGTVLRLGRGHNAHLRFRADPRMSRLHMQLTINSDGVEVSDLDSRRGSYVNARRVTSQVLVDGDILCIGGTEIQIHIDTTPVVTETDFE